MKKNSGFTLLELLITLALVTIVMAVGIPELRDFIRNDRLSTQINTLVGHLALARSEALKRHQPVVVCASSNQSTCQSVDWKDGWIVFADVDASSDVSPGDEMLRVQQPLDGGNTLNSSTGAVIIYDERGFAPNSAGSFSLCDERGATHLKSITISNTGRVRQGGSSSCT